MFLTHLLLLASITIHANALPGPTELSLPNSTAAITGIDRTIRCNPPSEQKIVARDCWDAQHGLPRDEDGDIRFNPHYRQYVYPTFSQTSAEERHRLPKSEEVGSCVLEVRLSPSTALDWSSWRIIILRIGNVIRQCVDLQGGVGGITFTGEEKFIEILVYAKSGMPEALEPGNGSVAIS